MTVYRNEYMAPKKSYEKDIHLHTSTEEYDLNYVCEVKELKSDRVELRPYIPSLHARLLFEGITSNPEIYRYLGPPLWKTMQDCLEWSEMYCRTASDTLMYAVYTDKPGSDTPFTDPKDYEFAGCLALMATNPTTMVSEPGMITILPKYQRTHVLTHAAGLAMHRILDPVSQGGFGFRRCQWITTTLNIASQNAGKRLGFKEEGVIRGNRILPPGKEACREGRKDSERSDWGVRDDWTSSVMWYEWEEGVRDHVDKLMARSVLRAGRFV